MKEKNSELFFKSESNLIHSQKKLRFSFECKWKFHTTDRHVLLSHLFCDNKENYKVSEQNFSSVWSLWASVKHRQKTDLLLFFLKQNMSRKCNITRVIVRRLDGNKSTHRWIKLEEKKTISRTKINHEFTLESYLKTLILGNIFHGTKEYLFLDTQDKRRDSIPSNFDEFASRDFSAIENYEKRH